MLTNTTAKITYTVVDGVTEYAIGFVYNWNPDSTPQIKVYKNKASNTPLEYGVNYTISNDGLYIVLVTGVEAGDRLDIIRNIPMVQLSNYTVGRIDPEQIESDADASVMRDQQIKGDLEFLGEVPIDHEDRIQELETDVDNIEGLIPNQATDENQLADKEFVNSSISTSTATFRGTYDSLAELEAVTADDNDYGFVVSTDQASNTVYSRYKYANGSWVFEYNLNNSSFTAEQWAAINSGITAGQIENWQENYGPLSIDAEIVTNGALTVNDNGDVTSTSGSYNYLIFPGSLNFAGVQSFEILLAGTTGTIANRFPSYDGLNGQKPGTFVLKVDASKVYFKVLGATALDPVQTLVGTTTLSPNTKYYIKLTCDGTNYTLSLSTDGVNYTTEATAAISNYITSVESYKILPSYDGAVLHMADSYIKKNGILIWRGMDCPGLHQRAPAGHEVIAFQAPTANNDYTWYRKYADGWVEQGGFVAAPASSTANVQVTLPVTMADGNYSVTANATQSAAYTSDSGSATMNSCVIRAAATNRRSTTGFYFSYLSENFDTIWEVKGMYAQS